jgi:ammonium transporter Rh
MLAEPLPKEKAFALSLGFFQILCLIGFAVHFDTQNASNQGSLDDSFRLRPIYGMYMDVHVMIFVGFGFLMTYLRKYS